MKKSKELTKDDMRKIRKELEDKTEQTFKDFDVQKRKSLIKAKSIILD